MPFVGIYGECTILPYGLQCSDLEDYERTSAISALWGTRTWPDGFCVEDGGILLVTTFKRPFEGVRDG